MTSSLLSFAGVSIKWDREEFIAEKYRNTSYFWGIVNRAGRRRDFVALRAAIFLRFSDFGTVRLGKLAPFLGRGATTKVVKNRILNPTGGRGLLAPSGCSLLRLATRKPEENESDGQCP